MTVFVSVTDRTLRRYDLKPGSLLVRPTHLGVVRREVWLEPLDVQKFRREPSVSCALA